jgi:excisionase family DNA binding protein
MSGTSNQNEDLKRTIKGMRADAISETVSTAEAASLLGISPQTLRTWVRSGRASARTIGGELRFSRNEVRRLFEEHRTR